MTQEVAAGDYNRRDYIQTLTESLVKHDILKPEEYDKLIEGARNKFILESIATEIAASVYPIEGAGDILKKNRLVRKS